MSYKTNSIGLRLKQTTGWKSSSFYLKNHTIESTLWLKIYLLLKAYLLMRNYKLLSCQLRVNEKFDKILYITILKVKKKKKKAHKIKKNRLQKQRYRGITQGLYNRYWNFFNQANFKANNTTWIKDWSYVKYPLNKLNAWTSIWWSRHIPLFLKKKTKKFKIELYRFVQTKKLLRDKSNTKPNIFRKKLHKDSTSFMKKKYLSIFLRLKLKKLVLRERKIRYVYLIVNKVFKTFDNAMWSNVRHELNLKHGLNVVRYLAFNKKKIKIIRLRLHSLRKKIISLKKIINRILKSKKLKTWKYKILRASRTMKHHQKIMPHQSNLLIRASAYKKLSNVWFLNLLNMYHYKKTSFSRNTRWFAIIERLLKRQHFIKSMATHHKKKLFFSGILKYCSLAEKNKIIKKLKRFSRLIKKHRKMMLKKRRKISAKTRQQAKIVYKRKYRRKKIIFVLFNKIPSFQKKPKYGLHYSYKKKQKPQFSHPIITQKDIKYLYNKKKSNRRYQRKGHLIIPTSKKKRLYEKNFQIKEFTKSASFKLLSNFHLKYNVENWIKHHFNIAATIHIFQPLRSYKNLNWYKISKPFFKQEVKKTIRKSNITNAKASEVSRYHLMHEGSHAYLKNKISKKKKSSIYLVLQNKHSIKTSSQEELFATSKWNIKPLLNRFIPLFSLFSTYLEPQLITDQIAKEFELTKGHRSLYKNLESVLYLLKTRGSFGFKIEIYGRFNASVRSQKKYLAVDNFAINNYKQRISYAFAHSYARIGCFGIKLWIDI